MSDSEDAFGPPLPPGMSSSKDKKESSSDEQYGPALPQKTDSSTIGPVLPKHLAKSSKSTSDSSDSSSDSSSYSSSDSDHRSSKRRKHKHKKSKSSKPEQSAKGSVNIIGPAIPKHLNKEIKSSRDRLYGPVLPGDEDDVESGQLDSDSDDDIGPSLGLQATEGDLSAAREFEMRAQKMKDRLTAKTDDSGTPAPTQRESWMTELPSEMGASFGLSNRQFRTKDAPEIDSSWTEGPGDKKKSKEEKKKKRKHEEDYFQSSKDKKAAKEIEEYNKKHRPKSLLEMHKKEMKKKKKKEKKKNKDKEKERRPFDRDVDLKVNRFDDAMKKAFIKRSQELTSRFKSGGTGSSFL